MNSPRNVFISTYGCQMNVNDSERMNSLLEMANYTPVNSADRADLIIINSCSVREKPVHKVYSEVGKYRKLKALRPHLKIGVGGCVGSQEKDNLIKNQPMIDFVFGTDNIDQLPELLNRLDATGASQVETQFRHREPYHIETMVRNPGVATFVNITKGCDNFCTFCVVPFTRGREKSRPMDQVMSDVLKLTARGVREITLLGQNVNSYESDCGADFADLLKKLALESDLQRIRYTTSHPKDFNQKLIDVMAEHQEKLCEYIHLPFQAGNSRVLELMNRGYTREEYLRKIEQIKKSIPNIVLSTDIIVGFPSETAEEFLDTVSLALEGQFETIFAFKYSPRPFTKAARFEDQVSEEEKDRRLAYLFEKHDAWARDWVQKKYENSVLSVLVEGVDDKRGNLFGRSTQNKTVFFQGDRGLIGQTVPVRVNRAFPATFRGEIVGQSGNIQALGLV